MGLNIRDDDDEETYIQIDGVEMPYRYYILILRHLENYYDENTTIKDIILNEELDD